MSVVDQLAVGALRRLLLRMTLVLGGVFAVTAVGWLLSSAAAYAGELPSAPPVSSLLDSAQQQLSTPDVTAALAKTGLNKGVLDKTTIDKSVLTKALPPALDTVTKRVDVLPHRQATTSTPRPVRHVHTAPGPAKPERAAPRPTTATPHEQQVTLPARPPAGGHHRAPVLPPLPPAGSSDSTMHGTGNLAGGTGGASLPGTPVLGTGLHAAGSPSTPRLAVAPGLQPGTSPD